MDTVSAILATDGRHSLLGRHSTPSRAELDAARDGLARQGLRGWLVRLHGNRWAKRGPGPQIEVMEPLHEGLTIDDLDAATKAYREAHRARLAAL